MEKLSSGEEGEETVLELIKYDTQWFSDIV